MAPERMFIPDETALEVLQLVDGARDLDAIIEALVTKFSAPRDVIAADVRTMVEDLTNRGALQA
jgi:pyrroloquinoline quinone biosynthesis protein D